MQLAGRLCVVLFVTIALSGCATRKDDFGIYQSDAGGVLVLDYSRQRLLYIPFHQYTPEQLLGIIKSGKAGIRYNEWRNSESCGFEDEEGALYVLPRKESSVTYKSSKFILRKQASGSPFTFGPDVSLVDEYISGVKVRSFEYDSRVGVKSYYYYEGGKPTGRYVLTRGAGILNQCAGWSLKDQPWYHQS